MTDEAAWTLGKLLTWTTDYLKRHGADSPRLDAEVLLAHARNCSRIQLYTDFAAVAEEPVRERYRELVKLRSQGTPVAYLVGHREFFSLDFLVTPDVLIPRPETEFVVVTLLDRAREYAPRGEQLQIADVGTGSGILAVCAALKLPNAMIWASDVSTAALAVAQKNIDRHAVGERVHLSPGELLQSLPADLQLDFVVSNPPYVSEAEWAALDSQVRDYEPSQALVGGPRGDELIRKLVAEAAERLVGGGWLILEISPTLVPHIDEWLGPNSGFEPPVVTKDLAQLPRVVAARRRNGTSSPAKSEDGTS